jgi:hypothetical protein
MGNPLYQQMMGNVNNPIQMLNQLRSNPIQFVLERGFNLPQGVGNDPNAIIQHLLNSGQVSQSRYNQVVQEVQNFNRR